MTDVVIMLSDNSRGCRVFFDGRELSGVLSLSVERGEIARVDLSIAPMQLQVIPPLPSPKPKRVPKKTARRRAR